MMRQTERLARAVAKQRLGDESHWLKFVATVEDAERRAVEVPGSTARDFLDDCPVTERSQPT